MSIDPELCDIDECVKEMERIANEKIKNYQELTKRIDVFKKKLESEENASKIFSTSKANFYF